MANKGLFSFEWPVDQSGYEFEWITPPPPSPSAPNSLLSEFRDEPHFVIRGRGGPFRYYRPLEDSPALARRFADLAATSSDDTAFLDFANEFGLLGLGKVTERIDDWQHIAKGLALILGLKDAGSLQAACTEFNEHVHTRFTAKIHCERVGRPKLEIVPATLAGALWFQVSGELTHGTKFKRCDWCPIWFPVGRGTGHRETRKFCSNRCRMAWHRHNKEKAK